MTDFYVVIPAPVLKLGPYAVAVYGALRARADRQSDECWPSHKTLAADAGVGVSKVQRVLAELRAHGWVSWTTKTSDSGGKTSNVYRVHGTPVTATPSVPDTDPHRYHVPIPIGTTYRRTNNHLEPVTNRTNTSAVVPTTNDDATRLANTFSELLTGLGVKHTLTAKWVTDLDRMMRLDGRTPEQVEGAMRWALADDFWSANIHSPATLRKQYDRLRLQAGRGNTKTNAQKGLDLVEKYRQMEAT